MTYEDSSFGPNTTITTSAPGSPIAARRQFLEMLEHVEATTTNLDLSNHGLDTVYDMESVFSSLQSVNLARNQLHSAAGLPSTVLKLQMSHNLLSDLSTFYHLPNLQELDISQNTITSLRCLGPLVHLRTLTANSCEILRLDGLECLAGVMKVSLDGNMITDLMLASGGQLVLPALEELSLGCNRMEVLGGLEGLSALKSLSVGMSERHRVG